VADTGRIARVARVVPTVRPLRIALAGCGTVGSALLELLVQHADTVGQPIRVVRVLVRDRSRPRPALVAAALGGLADSAQCITDASRLLDDDIDVLFEALGGTTTAATLVEGALRRGIRVVTANKALLAERGASLAAIAALNDTRFDFEGSVAGAVPVVRCIRSGAAGVGVTRFAGVLNGTSNFVLERVAGGESLADAIALAQRLGYAERDPSRDLSGEDAEDKLRILAWLAFGVDPSRLRVVRRGLDAETAAWAARVAAAGDRVKLLATCARDSDGSITARVIPTRVTADDPWAQVAGAANRIVVESASAGALVFHGAGAGGRATAGAMMADLFGVRALA
jgi:homoserine dehydrogenase